MATEERELAPDLLAQLLKQTPKPPDPQPVFDPRVLAILRPYVFMVLAALFWALSVASTVILTGRILRTGGIILPAPIAILIGLLIAGLISAGEVVTRDSLAYYCFLIPDIAFTTWWTWPALVRWSEALHVGLPGAIAGGLVLGYISARLPEHVAFGARARRRRTL